MDVYGLTGGIASGKSRVAEIITSHGFQVIDADLVARLVVRPGSEGLKAIGEMFGPHFIKADGSLDRRALRREIAYSKQSQQKLNATLHPLIRADIRRRLSQLADRGERAAFVEAALMIETGSYRDYRAVVLVTAPLEARLARLEARDKMSAKDARQLMQRQLSDEQKRACATVEVINDGTLAQLAERVRAALVDLELLPNLVSQPQNPYDKSEKREDSP